MGKKMDHQEATMSQAAERYTLNELTSAEREAFEDHFFTCEECADDVRSCALFVENAKALAKEEPVRPSSAGQVVEIAPRPAHRAWREWLTAVAAMLLLGTVGFQELVTIPRLKNMASLPGPVEAFVVHPTARGAAPVVHTLGNTVVLELEMDAMNAPASYEVTVQDGSGKKLAGFGARSSKDGILHLTWPASREPGDYEILVRDPNRASTEVARFPLHVER
jgi:hypothetical protein